VSESIEIWTDGGCQGNPGPGGWAYVIHSPQGSREQMGFERLTTNNRMELIAVREALRDLSADPQWRGIPVVISTDSQYVQKGITDWIHAWARNGWKTSAKKPVKNLELWSALWDLSRSLPLQWVWVKGHAGNEMNERCDFLVQQAIAEGLKRQG
jgi:ribonuclease HI